MENENKKYPVAEKQQFIAETPFKVLTPEPRDVWLTNYAYYLKQKRDGGSVKPLMGRKTEDGKFEVYENGSWIERDLWKDFSEDALDASGAVIKNARGQNKKQLLFDNKKEWTFRFTHPVTITFWDKETSQKVTNPVDECSVRLSKSLSEKLQEQMKVMEKLGVNNPYYVIHYDSRKSPAEQYKVEFSHKEE